MAKTRVKTDKIVNRDPKFFKNVLHKNIDAEENPKKYKNPYTLTKEYN